jgi:S-formylglutathione hydrolase FrmB
MNTNNPLHWFRTDASDGVAGFVAVGARDYGYVGVERRIAHIAHSDQMHLTLDIIPGGHNFRTWRHALVDAFPWIVARLTAGAPLPTQAPVSS